MTWGHEPRESTYQMLNIFCLILFNKITDNTKKITIIIFVKVIILIRGIGFDKIKIILQNRYKWKNQFYSYYTEV